MIVAARKASAPGAGAAASLAAADLDSSGLTLSFAQEAGCLALTAAEAAPYFAKTPTHPCVASLLFRYHDFDEAWRPRAAAYNRWKPLERPAGWGSQLEARAKYLQDAPTTMPYVPIIWNSGAGVEAFDWAAFIADPGHSLIITEGEKKALAAMNHGLPAIALGGVDCYGAGKRGEALHPLLARLARKRRIYIVYDIDVGFTSYKPRVFSAAERLATLLIKEGATPELVTLPSSVSVKTALDDWLVSLPSSLTSFDKMQLLASYAHQLDSAKALLGELARFVFVSELAAVADRETRKLYAVKNYQLMRNNLQVAMRHLEVDRKNETTALRLTIKQRGDAFLASYARQTVESAEYAPGEATITHGDRFNTWKGWAQPVEVEPDIEPFRRFLEGFHGEDAEYMLSWYLWPLRHPGAKIFTIPVLREAKEGIGKSTAPALLARFVYGMDNSAVLGADKLRSFKIEYIGERQFCLIDDANDNNVSHVLDAIKGITTQEMIVLNPKYINPYSTRNVVNLVITTNRHRPFVLGASDRRFFYPLCHPTVFAPVNGKPHPIFPELRAWFEAGGGGALVAYAQRHDFKEFDPAAPAPLTDAKLEQLELSESPLDRWARWLVLHAREYTRLVATAAELRQLALLWLREAGEELEELRISHTLLAKALREAGAERLGVWHVGATTGSLYALADGATYRRGLTQAIVSELFDKVPVIEHKVAAGRSGNVVNLNRKKR